MPFLRCRLVVVAAPTHPLAGRRGIAPSELGGQRLLVGPPDVDPSLGVGHYWERNGLAPRDIGTYASHAAAIAAAAAGDGVVLTLSHSVLAEMRGRTLVALDVRGTPITELWHASTLGLDRALPIALTLQRFATTPEATQAMSAGRVGTMSTRARPAVHVTLWRSVGA